MPKAISSGLRAAGALVTVSCLALGMAAPATAGSYRAAVCHAGLGAGRAEAVFERSHRGYLDAADCGAGGRGLAVSRERGRTPNGSWGAWSVRAPSGTTISRLSVYAAGRRGAGIVPELGIGAVAGPLTPIATPRPELRRVTWSGTGAQVLAARLRCRRALGCGRGRDARVRVKRLIARLWDRVPPTLRLGGSLFAPGTRRGPQTIAAARRRPRRRRSPPAGAGERRAGDGADRALPAGRSDRDPASSLPGVGERQLPRRHRLTTLPPGAEPGPRLRRRLLAQHRCQPHLCGAPSQHRQPLSGLRDRRRRDLARPIAPGEVKRGRDGSPSRPRWARGGRRTRLRGHPRPHEGNR